MGSNPTLSVGFGLGAIALALCLGAGEGLAATQFSADTAWSVEYTRKTESSEASVTVSHGEADGGIVRVSGGRAPGELDAKQSETWMKTLAGADLLRGEFVGKDLRSSGGVFSTLLVREGDHSAIIVVSGNPSFTISKREQLLGMLDGLLPKGGGSAAKPEKPKPGKPAP